jgi:hypothetical protein
MGVNLDLDAREVNFTRVHIVGSGCTSASSRGADAWIIGVGA